MKTRRTRKKCNNRVTRSKLSKVDAKCYQLKIQAKKNIPIIGVLTSPSMYNPYKNKSVTQLEKETTELAKFIDMSKFGHSSIQPEYMRWIENGGGIPVPIHYNMPIPLLRNLCSQLNGMVIPGGALENIHTHIPEHLYTVIRAVQTIVNYSKSQTDLGNIWPVWGTCQGFELLTSIATWKDTKVSRLKTMKENFGASDDAIKEYVDKDSIKSENEQKEDLRKYLTKQIRIGNQYDKTVSEQSDPLIFNYKIKNPLTKIFTKKEREDISTYPSVVFHHTYGFSVGNARYKKMLKSIIPLAWAKDHSANKKYLGIIKFRDYPIYGVAFHPEKAVALDPKREYKIEYRKNLERGLGSLVSIKLSAYFVNLARKSTNMWMGPPPDYLRLDKFRLNRN